MRLRINLAVLRDPSWLQWAATVPLLAAQQLGGREDAVAIAMALCAAMTGHYWLRDRSITSFPVQVRLGFMAFLLLASVPTLSWLLWVPLAGTTAQILFGYCPMARFLQLMPWNRETALTPGVALGVLLAAPGNDGLIVSLGRAGAGPTSAAHRGAPVQRSPKSSLYPSM